MLQLFRQQLDQTSAMAAQLYTQQASRRASGSAAGSRPASAGPSGPRAAGGCGAGGAARRASFGRGGGAAAAVAAAGAGDYAAAPTRAEVLAYAVYLGMNPDKVRLCGVGFARSHGVTCD